nr:unnamed protein product [Spirometra erinaceieuropaei]
MKALFWMVRSIIVCPEAYQTMLLHAFTHEREEIGGVLVGVNDGPETSVITVIPLPRTSEQSDRVEISGAELAGCIDKCEELSKDLETPVFVVGCHVDLNTQLNFQAMDRNFVGLIFSVFVHQPNSPGQVVSLLGFQSTTGQKEERINVRIQPLLKSSANFYQNEFISKAEASAPGGLKLLQYLSKTLELTDSTTESMTSFGKFMKLGLDLASDTITSTTCLIFRDDKENVVSADRLKAAVAEVPLDLPQGQDRADHLLCDPPLCLLHATPPSRPSPTSLSLSVSDPNPSNVTGIHTTLIGLRVHFPDRLISQVY